MASGKSNYLRNALLNHVLGRVTFTPPATVYLALSTAAWTPTATGSSLNEVGGTGTGYGRVGVPNDATNFPSTTTGSKANALAQLFAAAQLDWGTALSFYLVDASSGGNCLYGGDLTTARAIAQGDTPSFAPGSLVFQEQ